MNQTITLAKTLLGLLAIGLAAVIGCSDDDNPASSSIPPIMVQGAVYLSGDQLGGYLEFWDVTYSGKHPDSVRVGTHLLDNFSSWYWVPNDAYYGKSIWDLYDSTYSSGDTIAITLYYEKEMATVNIHLFDRDSEQLELYIASDSVHPLNTALPLTWSSNSMVDYYGVVLTMNHYDATSNGWPYIRDSLVQWTTTDTVLVIPGSLFSEVGGAYISISGIVGPRPTAEGVVPSNVSTTSMRGQIWGYTQGWGSFNIGEYHGFSPVVPGDDLDNKNEFLKLIPPQQ